MQRGVTADLWYRYIAMASSGKGTPCSPKIIIIIIMKIGRNAADGRIIVSQLIHVCVPAAATGGDGVHILLGRPAVLGKEIRRYLQYSRNTSRRAYVHS